MVKKGEIIYVLDPKTKSINECSVIKAGRSYATLDNGMTFYIDAPSKSGIYMKGGCFLSADRSRLEEKLAGRKQRVVFKITRYKNGAICLSFKKEGRPFGYVTRQAKEEAGFTMPPFCGLLGVNPKYVQETGIGEPYIDPRFNLPVYGQNGYTMYPVYKFYPERLKELDPDGFAEYTALLAV